MKTSYLFQQIVTARNLRRQLLAREKPLTDMEIQALKREFTQEGRDLLGANLTPEQIREVEAVQRRTHARDQGNLCYLYGEVFVVLKTGEEISLGRELGPFIYGKCHGKISRESTQAALGLAMRQREYSLRIALEEISTVEQEETLELPLAQEG